MNEKCATWAKGSYTLTHTHTYTMAINQRKQRLENLMKMLKSFEPPVVKRKFMAVASYNIGVSVKRIQEYLDLLVNMEVLEDEGDELKWLG